MRVSTMVALLFVLLANSASADNWQNIVGWCKQWGFPNNSIPACTEAINSGLWSGKKLSWFYSNRGIGYHMLGNYDLAIKDYSESLRLDPASLNDYHNRASANSMLANYDEAIKDYNKVIRLDPTLPIGYIDRGGTYSLMEDFERAMEDLNYAIKLDPSHVKAYVTRGGVYAKLDKLRLAIDDYNKALSLNPKLPDVYRARARSYCGIGKFEKSLADIKALAELGPEHAKREQKFLKSQGFYDGPIDGQFGPKSQDAERRYVESGCPK